MTTGYYRMHRGWMEHPAFGREPFTKAMAWCWLVEHAAWKDTTQPVGRHFVQVQRGQLAVAIRYLAEAWMWSKSSVDRFLTRLETGTMIGTQPGTQYSIITICNYDKYQGDGDADGTPDGTQSGTRVGHDRDKEEEVKKIRKTPSSDDPAFAAFWAAYPKREGKADALKAWPAAIKKASPDTITKAAARYAEQCAAKGTEPGFIKLAAGWLRSERWSDFPSGSLQRGGDLAQPTHDPRSDRYRRSVQRWKDTGKWVASANFDSLPPDHPDTSVPDFILAEFGLIRTRSLI